ncbi:MAG: hypothetical protein ACREQC_15195, partial [Candidatus Binataceae bacterium]
SVDWLEDVCGETRFEKRESNGSGNRGSAAGSLISRLIARCVRMRIAHIRWTPALRILILREYPAA